MWFLCRLQDSIASTRSSRWRRNKTILSVGFCCGSSGTILNNVGISEQNSISEQNCSVLKWPKSTFRMKAKTRRHHNCDLRTKQFTLVINVVPWTLSKHCCERDQNILWLCSELFRIVQNYNPHNCSELFRISLQILKIFKILRFEPKKACTYAGSFGFLSVRIGPRVTILGMMKERSPSGFFEKVKKSSANRWFLENQFWTILNIPGISEHFWKFRENQIWEYQHVALIRGDVLTNSQHPRRSLGRDIHSRVREFLGMGFSGSGGPRSLELN